MSQAVAAAAPELAPVSGRAMATVACTALGTWTYGFTWNAVGVALPHMQGSFSATTDQITWVMVAFIIGSATTTASIGWFANRFGRRQIYLAALAVYFVSLLGCAFAESLLSAALWRFLQGLSAAPLLPLGQVIAVNAFPPGRYSQAISLWAIGFVTGNVLGPTLAGYLIVHFGWPWIFLFNLPVVILVFIAAWVLVEKTPRRAEPLDWFGLTTLLVGVGVLQLILARGERLDWFASREIVIETLICGTALYLFLAHSFTTKNPFIDLGLFRNRNFAVGQVFVFMVGTFLYLPLILLPLLLHQIAGYPADATGEILMARGFGSVLSLIVMSHIRDRIDPRLLILMGLLLAVVPTWFMAHWNVNLRPWDLVWTNFLHGCAAGPIWAPLITLALSRLPSNRQDQGFALFYLNFDLGSSLGTVAIIALHTRHSQINHATLVERITPFSEQLYARGLGALWDFEDLAEMASLNQEIARQAAMIAYDNAFLLNAGLIASLIPMILLFRLPKAAKDKDSMPAGTEAP
mgnify:CR=1 FL=1